MLEESARSSIGPAWSGHRVGFDILRRDGWQFVAYYDADRHMTVAARRDGQMEWAIAHPTGAPRENPTFDTYDPEQPRLTTVLNWDSHNYVRMAVDARGYLHLSGNMHVDPLVYFRSQRPFDIQSFRPLDQMVGVEEDRCTYPVFIEGPDGELVFRYRHGRSGDGKDIYNRYDSASGQWTRLLDRPILDGMGRMNAYASVPTLGPDNQYHMLWVWRDTGDCATNHDLAYLRSRDLMHWETGDGTAVDLPVGPDTPTAIDPVPAGGGLLNGRQWLGFDRQHRPLIAYTKHDEQGHTQAYLARLESSGWVIRRISNWKWRWEFSGNGSIPNMNDIVLSHPTPDGPGQLRLAYQHRIEDDGAFILNERDLSVMGLAEYQPELPVELLTPESSHPGIRVQWMEARGQPPGRGLRHILRWESLDANRDRPRGEIPEPSMLRVHELRPVSTLDAPAAEPKRSSGEA